MQLQTPGQLKEEMPLSEKGKAFVEKTKQTIRKIFDRQDERLLIIMGPCSIHHIEEAFTFARKFKELSEAVKDYCFLIMRAYIEKPRTRQGWKGIVHDPHLNSSHDTSCGLRIARSLLIELAEMGVGTATEFLTPHVAPYIEDLISWGCIGARTSSSQVHRLLASSLGMPIGFKNSIDGNSECAISAIHVARSPHSFMHICDEGKLIQMHSKGNPYSHLVLRGSRMGTNYDAESIQEILASLRQEELPPRLLVDCSHGNSKGQYFKQKEVFQTVLEQIAEGNKQIMGMMLETNLEAGSQAIPAQLDQLQPGVSITDSCLDFAQAAELVSSIGSSRSMSLTHS